jgi:DNA repair protein RecO
MADRFPRTEALVIALYKSGESNTTALLLSPEMGLVHASVYGGQKGSGVASAQLFTHADFLLYQNGANGKYSIKETTFSYPLEDELSLEGKFYAYYMCELVSRTAEADAQLLFGPLLETLSYIRAAKSINHQTRALMHFNLVLLETEGSLASLDECPSCSRTYRIDETIGFSSSLCAPVCSQCSDLESMALGPRDRRYLTLIGSKSLEDAIKVEIRDSSCTRIRNYLIRYSMRFAQNSLKTADAVLNLVDYY